MICGVLKSARCKTKREVGAKPDAPNSCCTSPSAGSRSTTGTQSHTRMRACEDHICWADVRLPSSWHGLQTALECSYCSDRVTRHCPVTLRVRAAQTETRKRLDGPGMRRRVTQHHTLQPREPKRLAHKAGLVVVQAPRAGKHNPGASLVHHPLELRHAALLKRDALALAAGGVPQRVVVGLRVPMARTRARQAR